MHFPVPSLFVLISLLCSSAHAQWWHHDRDPNEDPKDKCKAENYTCLYAKQFQFDKIRLISEDHLCASDGEKVRCFTNSWHDELAEIPANNPKQIQNYSDVFYGSIVTVFDSNGVRSYKWYGTKATPQELRAPKEFLERKDFIHYVSTGESACAATKKQLFCVSEWFEDGADYDIKVDVSRVQSLVADRGEVCVIDSEGFRCWRRGHSYYDKNVLESLPKGLAQVQAVALTDYGTCVLDQASVTCWKDVDFPMLIASDPTLKNFRKGGKNTICYDTKDHRDTCVEIDFGVDNYHDFTRGYSFSNFLSRLASSVYREDRDIIKAALSLSQKWAPITYQSTPHYAYANGSQSQTTLFFLGALRPLIESIDSKKVQNEFLPSVTGTLEYHGIDSHPNHDTRLISETLISSGLRSLLRYLPDQTARDQVQAELDQIDTALSQENLDGANNEINQVTSQLSAFLDQLSQQKDLSGILKMIKWNQDFLAGKANS